MLTDTKKSVLLRPQTLRGRAVVARRAHNPEVVGSSPTPATHLAVSCFQSVIYSQISKNAGTNSEQLSNIPFQCEKHRKEKKICQFHS